jgi:2-iminobutanoate/2-iminopropanoate deaminase
MAVTRSNPPTVAAPIGSYSHVVRVETDAGTWLHVSGQIANDADGSIVGPSDLRAQTEQVFRNIERILEANGAGFEHVVKLQTFLTTLDDLAASREVRATFIPKEPPASTAVQVVALVVPEAMIEVDAVAFIPA